MKLYPDHIECLLEGDVCFRFPPDKWGHLIRTWQLTKAEKDILIECDIFGVLVCFPVLKIKCLSLVTEAAQKALNDCPEISDSEPWQEK